MIVNLMPTVYVRKEVACRSRNALVRLLSQDRCGRIVDIVDHELRESHFRDSGYYACDLPSVLMTIRSFWWIQPITFFTIFNSIFSFRHTHTHTHIYIYIYIYIYTYIYYIYREKVYLKMMFVFLEQATCFASKVSLVF